VDAFGVDVEVVDTLIALNACVAGFFAFSAIHHAVKWWFSRHERVLLVFWIQCVLYTAFSVAIVSYFRATTIGDAQAALERFVTLGVLAHAMVLQLYASLAGRRDRTVRVVVTGALVFLAVLNHWAPLRGTVLELQPMRLPGGSTAFLPIRTPPGLSLALLYLAVVVIQVYGFVATRTLWKRDRVGAALVGVASAAILGGAALGFLVDFAKVHAPYAGALPHASFVLSVALFLSREYAARGARLAASERHLQRSLEETRTALAELQTEQGRRAEAERARQNALHALIQAQRAELAGQLAAGVAHDFNNVLNVISLWSSAQLSESGPPIDKERARRAVADAQRQGQALSRQLVALARPEARSLTRFSLDRSIHRTVQTLTPALPRSIRLRFEASVSPEVEADENEIQQVIYNLVLNARDAMPDGGSIQIATGLEEAATPIGVVGGSLKAGRWATLSVIDTKGPERGTGLGLATVQRIAAANGGGVALETGGGRGAAFKVYLPCVSLPATHSPRALTLAGSERPEGPALGDRVVPPPVRAA
jgi:signal transduction histidine kinase